MLPDVGPCSYVSHFRGEGREERGEVWRTENRDQDRKSAERVTREIKRSNNNPNNEHFRIDFEGQFCGAVLEHSR